MTKYINILIADNFSEAFINTVNAMEQSPYINFYGTAQYDYYYSSVFDDHGDIVATTLVDNLTYQPGVVYNVVLADTGTQTEFWSSQALDNIKYWTAGNHFDVINFSFGGGYNTELQNIIKSEMGDGTIVVQSAPNTGNYKDYVTTSDVLSAANDNHIFVGASDTYINGDIYLAYDTKASALVDVILDGNAEGVFFIEDRFGTSFATPKVSAMIAEYIGTGTTDQIADIVWISEELTTMPIVHDLLVA